MKLTHVCTGMSMLRIVPDPEADIPKDVADFRKSRKSLLDFVDAYDEMDKPMLL